jgi:hypothetical protein
VDIHGGGDLIYPGAHRAISRRAGADLRIYDPPRLGHSVGAGVRGIFW